MELRIGKFCAAFVMAAVLLFSGATAASAAVGDCKSTYACGWSNDNYITGVVGSFFNYKYSGNLALGTHDAANSVASHGGSMCARFWENVNYGGRQITFSRPALGGIYRDPHLANGGGKSGSTTWNWENKISSVQFVTC